MNEHFFPSSPALLILESVLHLSHTVYGRETSWLNPALRGRFLFCKGGGHLLSPLFCGRSFGPFDGMARPPLPFQSCRRSGASVERALLDSAPGALFFSLRANSPPSRSHYSYDGEDATFTFFPPFRGQRLPIFFFLTRALRSISFFLGRNRHPRCPFDGRVIYLVSSFSSSAR